MKDEYGLLDAPGGGFHNSVGRTYSHFPYKGNYRSDPLPVDDCLVNPDACQDGLTVGFEVISKSRFFFDFYTKTHVR